MSKPISLTPSQQGDLFILNLPPSISPTGKRARKTFRSRKEALTFVEDLKRQQETGLRVARRAHPDLIRTAVDADELFRSVYGFHGGLPEAVAEFMERLDRERKLPTFEGLMEAFERDHAKDWARGSRDRQSWFRKHVEGMAIPAGQLFEPGFWADWLNLKAATEGWADKTFNDVAGMLSSIFEHGVKRAAITYNPIKGVKRRKVKRKARAVFTVDQVRDLMAAAWNEPKGNQEMVPYFALAVFAGLRPADTDSEISKLTWEDINWEEGWIRVGEDFDTKTETKRHVRMEDNLRAWLEPFRGRSGKVVPKNLRKRRKAITDSAGVPWGPSVRDISRHTYGSYLDAKHRDYKVICEMMGHTSITTYQQHYRNTRTRAEGAEFWAIMPPIKTECRS